LKCQQNLAHDVEWPLLTKNGGIPPISLGDAPIEERVTEADQIEQDEVGLFTFCTTEDGGKIKDLLETPLFNINIANEDIWKLEIQNSEQQRLNAKEIEDVLILSNFSVRGST
jgi:hypothetical protein